MPQLTSQEIILSQKTIMKKLKTEYLEILETILNEKKKTKQLKI